MILGPKQRCSDNSRQRLLKLKLFSNFQVAKITCIKLILQNIFLFITSAHTSIYIISRLLKDLPFNIQNIYTNFCSVIKFSTLCLIKKTHYRQHPSLENCSYLEKEAGIPNHEIKNDLTKNSVQTTGTTRESH